MGHKNITVYLVEDYSLTRMGMRAVLGSFKNIVPVGDAGDVEVALNEIFELKPNVVLMNIGLSFVNSFHAARKIKKVLPDTKLLMLTSRSRASEILGAISSGATGYCLKNIRPELLCEVIKMVDEGGFWLDSSVMKSVLKYFPKIDNFENMQEIEMIETKYSLSKRELSILKLIIEGKSNEEISKEMCISIHTTKAHLANIFRKLSVKDRVQAAVKTVREKLVE